MVDFLIQEMDKSIAEVYFREKKVNLGIKYFEKYLTEIKELENENPDDETLAKELTDAKDTYLYHLLENAKIAYNDKLWIKSLTCCQKLLQYKCKDTSVYKYTSLIYKNLNQNDIRLKFAKKYFELEKEDPDRNRFLGEAYVEARDEDNMQTAIDLFHKHLEEFPDDYNVYNMIGHIYANDGPLQNADKQLEYFLKAYEIAPKERMVLKNLALTYLRLKQPQKTAEIYEQMIEKGVMNNDDYFDYAALLIKHGDLIKGFKYYSHRFLKEHDPTFYPEIKQKQWTGKPLPKDKMLLIHSEQGYGDMIMFSRFIPIIKEKYAPNLTVVMHTELCKLFENSYPNIPFLDFVATDLEKLKFNCHLPVIEIPKIIGLTKDTIPSKGGYISVKNADIENYKNKYLSDIEPHKLKIGLAFEGASHAKSQERDIEFSKFKKVSDLNNVQMFAFVKERDNRYYKQFENEINIINLSESLNDFNDTAAALMNMDLIISTDSVILNLAGALGLKTYGLFNENYEYRWFELPESTAWYTSVKPFVAQKQNEWDEVIDRVCEEIKKDYPECAN